MAVRRVRRIIRKIDPWTVLKVSLIFNAIGGLVFILGVWVMWSLAVQRGIPDQVSEFFANFALVFTPEGELYFRVVVLLTIITVVFLTGLMTLGAVMYNLISDVVGGIELIVLEETYAAVAPVRQAPVRPAIHAIAPVEPVESASPAPAEDAASDEEAPSVWTQPAAAADQAIEDADEDEDITVEDEEAPVAAASEG